VPTTFVRGMAHALACSRPGARSSGRLAAQTSASAVQLHAARRSRSNSRSPEMSSLILKRASANRSSGGEWNDDDFDVLADGVVVGRIFKANASPVGSPWMWTLAFGHHEDRSPTHGYEPTREAAMAAFAKSWRRE
jgi:hypothetical protein